MARYSPIAPIQLLEEMYDEGILGNYLLLLAHDVLKQPHRYEMLMLEVQKDPDAFIIMDNSVVELGKALPAYDVIEAACVVEASVIMTPDAMGGFHATQMLVEDQIGELIESGFPLMKVPQGKDLPELYECIEWLHEYSPSGDTSYWGIPRWITNHLGTRKHVIDYIDQTIPLAKIHLLGMSEKFNNDILCVKMQRVMGIDSANPVVMGMAGMDLAYRGSSAPPHLGRGDLWEQPVLSATAIRNIEYMHNAVSP